MFKKRSSKKTSGNLSDSGSGTTMSDHQHSPKRTKSSRRMFGSGSSAFLNNQGAAGVKKATVGSKPEPDPQGRYIPPTLSVDTIDNMINDVDHHGNDRYRAVMPTSSSPSNVNHSNGYHCDVPASPPNQPVPQAQPQFITPPVVAPQQYQQQLLELKEQQQRLAEQPRLYRKKKQQQQQQQQQRRSRRNVTPTMSADSADTEESEGIERAVSEMTSQSFDDTTATSSEDEDGFTSASSYSRMPPPSRTRNTRDALSASVSSTVDSDQFLRGGQHAWSEDYAVDYFVTRQRIAFMAIGVSAVQLMILIIQLLLCGVASVEVNWMIGPYPDAFSEWGGKNVYLMMTEQQYWRIISPVLLHVGILHLLANVFCQLETCAFFEREWGSCRWLFLYLVSGVGAVAASSVAEPDSISVVSSGALMGLYGAKISQIMGWTMFELQSEAYYDSVRLDQLSGVMCSLAVTTSLSYCSYIDWAGQVGGLASGFLGGMFIFSRPLKSICAKIFWGFTGLLGLVCGFMALGYLLYFETSADEDLADVCSYFRNLYPEGYDCECVWN